MGGLKGVEKAARWGKKEKEDQGRGLGGLTTSSGVLLKGKKPL